MIYRQWPRYQFDTLQRFFLPAVLLLLAGLLWLAYARPFDGPSVSLPDFGRSALAFIPNAGQSSAAVRYLAHSQGFGLYVTDDGLTFSGVGTEGEEAAVVSWRFIGADTVGIQGVNLLPGVANYLHGSNPAGWQKGLPTYGAVEYETLYPGIDVALGGVPGYLSAVFQIEAGVDPQLLNWQFEGAKAQVSGTGSLELLDENGQLLMALERPLITQSSGSEISGGYVINGAGHVGLVVGDYDPAKALEINLAADLSGYTPTGLNEVQAVVSNSALESFVTGYTSSHLFPIVDPLQDNIAGGAGADVFITKFSENGEVLFSTYFGGSLDDMGQAIALDSAGNPIFTGFTYSTDFPLQNALMTDQGGIDAFVSKISANGSQLLFSTYLGGSDNESGSDIAVSSAGDVLIYGTTLSPDFPLLNPIQAALAGGVDLFLTQITGDGDQLLFSTYLGGSSHDLSGGLDFDQNGDIFLAGATESTDFPVANTGILQPPGESGTARNVFTSKISADGSGIVFSAIFGGTDEDYSADLSLDPQGNAFVAGTTYSNDFPVAGPIQNVNNGDSDAFITKVANDGSSLLFSTYLGGHLWDHATSIVVGGAGNVFVTGYTWSNDFPQLNPIPGMGYPGGGGDAFVIRHSNSGELAWSTYLGGTRADRGLGIDVDGIGRPVIVGSTNSFDFPLANAFQTGLHGIRDGFVSRLNHAGSVLEFSTYLGGRSGYPGPTDVALSGIGGTAEPNVLPYLIITGLLVLLFIGVWRTKRRRFQ